MKGDGQRELFRFLCETFYPLQKPTGGNRDMTGSDVQQFRMVDNPQGEQRVVVVGERLSLPHHHNIGYAFFEIILDDVNLVNELAWVEAAREACLPRSAKAAIHGASRLAGDAHGQTAIGRGKSHRFDQGPIVEFQKILS